LNTWRSPFKNTRVPMFPYFPGNKNGEGIQALISFGALLIANLHHLEKLDVIGEGATGTKFKC